MKIICNAIFRTHKPIMSLWTIIIFWICLVQPSSLKSDLDILERNTNSLSTKKHATNEDRYNFKFKHDTYNVTIPENSVGKTYAKSLRDEDLMGLIVPPNSNVKYRIVAGDRDKLFKAEERIVGDTAFLTIRTRTSNVVLNREKNEEYALKVRAAIVNGKDNISHEAETQVHVKVLDTNDLSPLFYPTEYSQNVPEDTPIHKSILKVMAEDADIGINGEIYYSLLKDNEYFSIHPTSGVISLTRRLKYADHSHFEFIVIANDRGSAINHYSHQASKAKVSIHVEQVNLYAPEIYFNTLPGTSANFSSPVYGIVRVSDRDSGRHGKISKLEIVDGNQEQNFQITPAKSEGEYYIEINRFAKLNSSSTYNLTLRAEDKGIPARFSFKTVPVQIIKENNNPPVFTKHLYEVSIPETSPPNMPVIRLKVTDPNLGKNALVYLEIVGGNEGGEFRINPDSGMLYTQKKLDAESKSFYTLTVSAIDQANVGVRKQSSAKVKINIEDMNDNDPIFEHLNTTLVINENELAGTYVVKVTAKDIDSGENSYISYSIANLNDVPFDIDHFNGVIRTKTLIDYETMRREYVLSVRASDWGLPYRRQTEMELLIYIKDINDNRPQFERINCVGKVLRNVPVGTDIFTLSAIDFDAGDYITYQLISGNEDGCFNLDPSTGVLSVGCDLTDVGVSHRTINVSSTDGTHFSDQMSIQIQLTNDEIENVDLSSSYGAFECRETGVARRLAENMAAAEKNNDKTLDKTLLSEFVLIPSRYGENVHQPEFVDFPQELKINESAQLGETILWIRARDRDLGYNGKLIYAITDGDYDSVFRIDPDTGEMQIIGFLDRERQDEYVLNITVFDLGQPQKLSSRILPVTILDCNDNRPVFQNTLISLRITENTLNKTLIFCLNATDADAGRNAEITYSLQSETSDFSINKTTGCIYLSNTLDREKQEKYELYVIATDNGIHPLSAEALVNVLVEDVNDNAPQFGVQEIIFKLREDIPRGTVVASIEACDLDEGVNGEIYFSLKEDMVDEGLFKIDKYTGIIRTQNYLDYETRQVHNLIVSAIDRGTPSLTSDMPIVIEIIDVNENRYAPEFDDFVYAGRIKENSPKGTIVMNITATDLDKNNADSRISYSIRGGDGLGVFGVTEQGSIRSLSHLDAETKSSYWLTYCAQDHAIVPLSSCVQVYIEIENENDNVPLTEKPVYYRSVPEGSPPKLKIIQLIAYDDDSDSDLEITYKITSGNPEGYFEINSTTGELTTTERKLDRENQSEHILEVSIFDNGLPPLSSTTTVVIAVLDINDHIPEFDQRFYKIQIPSTTKVNESVYQVQAIDNDTGENSHITYFIKSGKGKNKFRMDAETGFIYLVKPLELDMEYDLNIRAEDNGSPKHGQNAKINIVVVAIASKSPNAPVIKTVDNVVDVTESDRPGFLVALIQASDVDNDYLWFNICDGNEKNDFFIGRDNGNVLLSKSLDWEVQKFYNLSICVTDGTHIAQTRLYVQVIDTNDNRPKFSEELYHVNISENVDEEAVILQLHAIDEDEDKKIFYTLHAAQDPASLSLFRVDSITGNVLVTQRLDYEKNAHHVLIVIAKDQGTPAKRNYAKIIITVYDHNDHYPEFTSKIIQSKIPESAAVGSMVVQLCAVDHDSGKNAEIRYSIITGNIGNTFEVDPALGIVTLAKTLNINKIQEYMLQVKANDLGEPSLSSQMPLHIIVTMSENDPPIFLSPMDAIEIFENLPIGAFVTQVEARSSSSIFYEIIAGNDDEYFHINPSTGVITTNGNIDYEVNRSFNITIRGTNMVSATATHDILIHILDINDNAPQLVNTEYFGYISEAAVLGSFVAVKDGAQNSPLLIKSRDLDDGVNGMVEYRIIDDMAKGYFKIESLTGAIKLLKQLDYETKTHFSFGVMVNDMGTPKLYSKTITIVYINVTNVNDCAPVFINNNLNVTLYLPTYNNVIVTTMNATDADKDDRKIRYDIVDGNADDCFEINQLTGMITTRNIDRINTFYSLHIRASDGLYSSIAHVDINVETSNDAGFVFQKPLYEFSTTENSTKILTIGLVNVVGSLLHEDVQYQILNPTQMFVIGQTSGAIKTTGMAFDRETQDKYTLIVEAKSSMYLKKYKYTRRANVLVEVSIQDVNDNCPIFVNQPYYATVSVDDLKGTVITKVKAIDLDSYENGEVRYEMKKGNGELFKIDRKSGELILKQSIEGHNQSYDLIVAAYDGAVTPCATSASVHIKIIDRSMPIFDKQFYTDTIKENAEIFSALSMAVQAESPLGRKLIYTISKGNEGEFFEIDYRTGALYIVNELDYESSRAYEFVVRATDSVSGIFAEVTVSIGVEDTNDNYPQIERDNYNITLPENLLIGTQILKINATDRDTNANGKLSYFIESCNGRNDTDLFYIDMTDGSLYLKNVLDFEQYSFHYLIISVKDHGTPSLASRANVWITVEDLNDNSPKFVEPSISSRISINATRGQFVTIVKAYDPDYSDNDHLEYKIVDGNELQTYAINESSGIVNLQNMQNFTDKQQVILNISASDGVHTTYSRVKILLISENMFSPVFLKSTYEVDIKENEPVGLSVITVYATDPDFGKYSTLVYNIVTDEMRAYFAVDKETGAVTTKVSFDRERRSFYEVLVKVTDGGGKFGFTIVKVNIGDKNDNSPEFYVKEYTAFTKTNVPANTTILKIKAFDLDEKENGLIRYTIDPLTLDVAYNYFFALDEVEGTLKVLKSAESLTNKIVQFFVRATDNGKPQMHKSVPVTINFLSADIDTPEFEKEVAKLQVLESTTPGSTLIKLKVSGNFSTKFSIATESPKFAINDSGELTLVQTLDREESDFHYIVVVCETATTPPLHTSSEVYIHVQDENDNSPHFDSSMYSIEVAENIDKITSIMKVTATDRDSGPNSDIRYYLDDEKQAISNIFDIDIYSGWITLLTSLDRELESEYYFNVMASDNGKRKHISKVPVAIKILDYNDNPPLFKQETYKLTVKENALPGSVLTYLLLTDLDAEKTHIDYYIISGDKLSQFQIGKSGEFFVSKPLDRETIPAYNLTVLATDGKFLSKALILIAVEDVNDNIPCCITPRYHLVINESVPIGTALVKITALDRDAEETESLRYYLTGNQSDHFVVDKETGILKVFKLIDRESTPRYTLTAHIKDGQELWRECTSEVFITVNDLNDNKPKFSTAQYIVSIPEDAEVQTLITKIHATDRDFGKNRKISYSFVNDSQYFNICKENGIVKLARGLDRESISIYNLTVKAEDHGEPSQHATAKLIVNVLDVNDNPPDFDMKEYQAFVYENTTLNAEVLRVFATSKDIGLNAEVIYSIIGGNEQNRFHINAKTGVIYVNSELDYEKTKSYYLTIQGIDAGTPPLSNEAYVNITVLDVNDNMPQFSQNLYRVKVKEDIPIGSKIVKVLATDEDAEQNGLVRYTIERGGKLSQFSIEALSGELLTTDTLDRETIADYVLEVKACDTGVPELCNYVQIHIDVLDTNDNPPLFASQNYSLVLQENKNLGYKVLTFNITDADEKPNTSPYTFDIRSGNDGGFFRIEQEGVLITAARFNHKISDLHTLQIRVFDNGTPPMYSDTWVYVRIVEESQYPPAITPLDITVRSFEDDFAGGYIGSVFATDQDKYDTLAYSLSAVAGEPHVAKKLFNISQNNGSIFAISNLDIGLYKLNVSVFDGKFSSSTIVKINVELVTAEMLQNAAVIRFNNVAPEDFVLRHRKGFIRALRSIMRCRQKDIIIIAFRKSRPQSDSKNFTLSRIAKRYAHKNDNTLDVVFAIRKQQIIPNAESYFTTEEVRSSLIDDIEMITESTNLDVEEILDSACANNVCVHGKCVKRVTLNKNKFSTFYTDVISFVVPNFSYANECQCYSGYDGKNCNEVMNACSSNPCPPQKHCWPADSVKGYQCICPEGYTGQFCESISARCQNSSCLNTYTTLSFSGKSYAHYKINKSVAQNVLENQFICSFRIRTVQQTSTILYASGKIDYNILEIYNGAVQYRFDLGSGEGVISVSSIYVPDGEWHSIKLERIFNSAKVTVDGKHVSQGSAPGVNGILNIQSYDVFVGAEIHSHPSIIGFEDIQRGFIGCMSDMKFALEPLPLYIAGGSSIAALKRFTNVEFTCDPMNVLVRLGICGSQPCLNGGVCSDLGNSMFKCTCHERFTGRLCETDTDPCASSPCLFGGRCELQEPGNYTCLCPLNLSGRRCEYGKFCMPNPCKNGGICEEGDGVPHCMCRGYTGLTCDIDINECDNYPCGNGATCINEAGSFRCICPVYLTGASCGDPLYSNSITTKLKNLSMEHITGIISGVTIIFIVIITVLCCILLKRNNSHTHNHATYGKNACKNENLNSLAGKEKYSKHNLKLSNLEVNRSNSYAQSTNDSLFASNATFVNNLDTLRSYGSAGEELESIPFEYQKINRTNQQQININTGTFNEPDAAFKQDWCEQMHLRTFSENKLNNEKVLEYGLPFNHISTLRSNHGRITEVNIPNVCKSTNTGEQLSLNHGQYHWDCSDWVRKSLNPLPDITEVPSAEIVDSSSFHSNDSNESRPRNSYFAQNDSRDLATLKEDLTSEYVDSELESFIQPFPMPLETCKSLSRLSTLNDSENEDYKNNADNTDEMLVFKNFTSNKYKSNSNISVRLCEIEDSELEEFLPTERRQSGNQ